ncbi:HAD-IA family hydrolase [Kitasatospora sp. NBC_01287]|uniref:HAD family hydrolase n=1 Tax=Kitasatospora sp. NBC_01287 TaxID=2903573 RepID=UPI00225B13D0|nr:HAD-IA family hydrolase [Kitasatospora sp. NBC_01287]MCX4748943.1 HAD-IA family hydrolase [Kitasatospora sp. NBC_01287]
MPLLLLDLDNTLLPRDAAYRAWAAGLVSDFGLPPSEVDWLCVIDGGGYVPRDTVLSAARRRYGLDLSLEGLLTHYRRGINSHISCPSSHTQALRAARTAGWTIAIVSNGGTGPQLEKIRRTGLSSLVDAWVVSEEAGCAKPDPLIFEIAAQRCGLSLAGDRAAEAWVVGDHGPADIAGAELAGIRSVWLRHGRPWSEQAYRPTLCASGLPEAIALVLADRELNGMTETLRTDGSDRSASSQGEPLTGQDRSMTDRGRSATGVDGSASAWDETEPVRGGPNERAVVVG